MLHSAAYMLSAHINSITKLFYKIWCGASAHTCDKFSLFYARGGGKTDTRFRIYVSSYTRAAFSKRKFALLSV